MFMTSDMRIPVKKLIGLKRSRVESIRSELYFSANENSCNEEILQSPASCNASVGLRSHKRRGNCWDIWGPYRGDVTNKPTVGTYGAIPW